MLLILVAAAIPGMAVAILLTYNALRDERAHAAKTAEWLARLQASYHTNIIENAETMLDTVSGMLAAVDGDRSDCRAFLRTMAARYQSFTSLTNFAPSGTVRCTSAESELPYDATGAAWFEAALKSGNFTVGDYTVGKLGTPLIVAAQAVKGADGKVNGVLAVGIELRWMDYLTRNISLPEGARVVAVESKGSVLTEQTESKKNPSSTFPGKR